MDPLAPAAIRAAGTVAKVAVKRYRPAGVARVGSAEDRAQSYRRFLDAIATVVDSQIIYYFRRRDVESARGMRRWLRVRRIALREEAWANYVQAQFEAHAALLGLRLCAPAAVLAAAEDVTKAIPRFCRAGTDLTLSEDDYLAAHDLCGEARAAFLETARKDLAYDPRPWQWLRKRRERKFLEQGGR